MVRSIALKGGMWRRYEARVVRHHSSTFLLLKAKHYSEIVNWAQREKLYHQNISEPAGPGELRSAALEKLKGRVQKMYRPHDIWGPFVAAP